MLGAKSASGGRYITRTDPRLHRHGNPLPNSLANAGIGEFAGAKIGRNRYQLKAKELGVGDSSPDLKDRPPPNAGCRRNDHN